MNDDPPNPLFPRRARPVHALPRERHNQSIIIFLTVCAKDRKRVLANDETHSGIRSAWLMANHWLVGRYLIMPDHLHVFCAPGTIDLRPLDKWVGYWKGGACEALGAGAGTLWQRDFWDTQLRHRDDYALKWDYVRNNPVRAGLVTRSEDWPYQGELNVLRWHA